jgi:nucleoid DNA-binding protein
MGHTQHAISDIISKELQVPVLLARQIIQKFLDIVADDIVYTNEIKIRGLGTLYVTVRPAMETTHPVTGKPVFIPEKKTLRLKTSSSLKKRLNPPGKKKTRKPHTARKA